MSSKQLPVFHRLDTVGSTNDVALELAKSGCAHGTVVIAQSQTGGKGRLGRQWWDVPGESVLMSIVLRWPSSPESAYQSAFVVSLGAAEAIESECGLPVNVKWPNDLMANGKKLTGILVETITIAGRTVVVAGIGVNVLQSVFPEEISDTATSILLQTERKHNTNTLAERMAESILVRCEQYAADGFPPILAAWRKRMYGISRTAEVTVGETEFSGIILGVDDSGHLLLKTPDNQVHTVTTADRVRIPRHPELDSGSTLDAESSSA